MSRAARQELSNTLEKTGQSGLYVSGDGSWRKPGFDSLQGFAAIIGHETQKVLDVEAKSRYCKTCEIMEHKCGTQEYDDWLENHCLPGQCDANHEGSAASIEVHAMVDMFMRSQEKHQVVYENYIGDGDSKTHKAINEAKPYKNISIIKKEDIGHIQKRFGTRVRKLTQDLKGHKMSDGKSFSGVGRMTSKKVDILQQFYGNSIRQNCHSVPDMRKAVMATCKHYMDTHEDCPEGKNSWCKYQVANAEGQDMTKFELVHKIDIPKACMEKMVPIYKALSSDSLLESCLGGYSQNSNESLNGKVWRIAPKKSFSGISIFHIGVNMGVSTFNDGQNAILDLMTEMEVNPGANAVKGALKADERRLLAADVQAAAATLESRRASRRARIEAKETAEAMEGALYAPGAF